MVAYGTAVMAGFFGILIYLFYLGVFGILHGAWGMLVWTFTALILALLARMIFS